MGTVHLAFDRYRERLWLKALEANYFTSRDIAAIVGLSISQINRRLRRARLEPPDSATEGVLCLLPRATVPMAVATCRDVHEDPIERGSHDYCPICDIYGCEHTVGVMLDGEQLPTEPASRGRTVPARDVPGLKGGMG